MTELSPPAHDMLNGTLIHLPDRDELVLLLGDSNFNSDLEIIRKGNVCLCYGLAYLHQPAETLLVQWAYDDFRREYHGDDALRFVLQRGVSFPRADVMGRQVSTGEVDQRFLKELDIGARLRAVAYRSLDAKIALGQVGAMVWLTSTTPRRLRVTDNDDRMSEWMRCAVDSYQVSAEDLGRLSELLTSA